MATNKNALLRYKVLDNCFRNSGRRYFIDDLIKECEKVLIEIDPDSDGISRRQIFEDIAFMESQEGWSVDLVRMRDGKKVYYSYAEPSFSINNMPLNEIEINQLKSAVDILSQFKGMPQFGWINELIPKLNHGLHSFEKSRVIMEFDNNQYLKGIEYIGVLYNSILYKKVLSITYKPFQSDISYDVNIHPYYLKQFNNRWFVFGYNPEKQKDDWNLALDRILDIIEISDGNYKESQIDWSEYFEDIIGVTKPEGAHLENISLHFSGKAGKYIETKPIHGSQKSKWISIDILEVTLQLIINYEFERLIISYADDVKVIYPTTLKEMLIGRHKSAIIHYDNPKIGL